jgi:hypothetical protein
MSILTTLALMTSAVVAKLHEPSDVEATRLQAKVDDLERELEDVNRELDRTILDLTTSRIETDRWRVLVERHQGREGQRQLLPRTPELDAEFRAQQQTRALMAYAQMQQVQAQTQQMQMDQQYFQQNQGLAQQGLQGAYESFCNCVPARHDMFLQR